MKRGSAFFDAAPAGTVYAARILGPATDPDLHGLWFGQSPSQWSAAQRVKNVPDLNEADIRGKIQNLRGAIATAGGTPKYGEVEIVEFALVAVRKHPYKKGK